MSNYKSELIKEVFELELFKKLKEKFPDENIDSAVMETIEGMFQGNEVGESTLDEVSKSDTTGNP